MDRRIFLGLAFLAMVDNKVIPEIPVANFGSPGMIATISNLEQFMGKWEESHDFGIFGFTESRIGKCLVTRWKPALFYRRIDENIVQRGEIYGPITLIQYRNVHGETMIFYKNVTGCKWVWTDRIKIGLIDSVPQPLRNMKYEPALPKLRISDRTN